MWNSKPTLSSRLSKSILLLTVGLTLLFTLVTLFIAYSLEDAMFNQQLKQGHDYLDQGYKLPYNIKLKPNLHEFGLSPEEQKLFLEFDETDKFGEFTDKGRHYHYKTIPQGALLIDTTDLVVVSRGLKDIVLIIVVVMLPALAFAIWLAKKTSVHALKPFNQLKNVFLSEQHHVDDIRDLLKDIEEHDIKLIAEEIVQALDEKSTLLEQQIAFNQGMSHELRTPLQVMTHSLELLSSKVEQVQSLPSYKRVVKSIARMQRISNGLLWLTSNETSQQQTQVNTVLAHVLTDAEDLTQAHHINVRVAEKADLKLPMPSIVFELIVMNLLNNVVHHGKETNSQRKWRIDVASHAISFTNDSDRTTSKDADRFGLGLMLVSKLCDKFGVSVDTKISDKEFSIKLG